MSFDAELLTCELVTNAVLRVDVMDDGQTGFPHWREATSQDEGGRGFQFVNELAQRWGFLRERARTCVWFELVPGNC